MDSGNVENCPVTHNQLKIIDAGLLDSSVRGLPSFISVQAFVMLWGCISEHGMDTSLICKDLIKAD